MSKLARTIAPFVAAVGLLLGIGAGAPASASELPPHRWETPRTVCVESRMGSNWTSPREAVQRLHSSVWQWNLVYRTGSGGCSGYGQVITINRVVDANRGRAWTNRTTVWKTGTDGQRFASINTARVYINTHSKFSRTWAQNVRTVMHEVMHGMAMPRGATWSGGHTSRCDSLLTSSHSCLMNLNGPTAFDRQWIGDLYAPWTTFTVR